METGGPPGSAAADVARLQQEVDALEVGLLLAVADTPFFHCGVVRIRGLSYFVTNPNPLAAVGDEPTLVRTYFVIDTHFIHEYDKFSRKIFFLS